MLAGQQFIRHAGQRVDIVTRIGLAVLEHLRAGVGRRHAAQRAGIEHGLVRVVSRLLESAGDAEVDHLDLATIGQEHIGRLEIAMHEAALVRIGQRPAHADNDRQRLGIRQAREVRRAQHAVEGLPGQIFHGQEDRRAVPVEVVDGDDIPVRQRLRLARLALQCHQGLGVPAELEVQHLDGDIGLAVGGF
ncbi:hypothetical protein D3C72_1122120 [compost metagenome]